MYIYILYISSKISTAIYCTEICTFCTERPMTTSFWNGLYQHPPCCRFTKTPSCTPLLWTEPICLQRLSQNGHDFHQPILTNVIYISYTILIYIYIQILNLYILILYFILDIPQCHCRTRHKTSLPPESSTSEQWDLHDLHAPENVKPSQQQWLFKVTALMLCLANFWTLEPQCACPTEKQELGAELVSLLVSEHSLRIGPEYSQQFIATTMDFTSMSNWCAETQNTSKSITCNLCFPLKVSTCSSSARQVLWWKCSSRASLHFSMYSNTPKTHALLSVARFHLRRPRKWLHSNALRTFTCTWICSFRI